MIYGDLEISTNDCEIYKTTSWIYFSATDILTTKFLRRLQTLNRKTEHVEY